MDGQVTALVQTLPKLEQLHLLLPSLGEKMPTSIFYTPTGGVNSKRIMFSLATRLTFQGYDFNVSFGRTALPSFPALRALTVVDCRTIAHLFLCLQPEEFPVLTALMVKTDDGSSAYFIESFVEGLSYLRELIVHGYHVRVGVNSGFLRHAQTLELLCLHDSQGSCVIPKVATETTFLDTFTALRHLGLTIADMWYQRSGDLIIEMPNSCLPLLVCPTSSCLHCAHY
jgi:hypothetical protein